MWSNPLSEGIAGKDCDQRFDNPRESHDLHLRDVFTVVLNLGVVTVVDKEMC